MARKPSNRSRIQQLSDEWEPVLKLAFLDAVRDITSRAELGRIAERLEKGDIAGAIEAVHLDPAAFRTLDRGIAGAFDAGGFSTIGALPVLRGPSGGTFVVRWDARNIRAENWLRLHSSTLITRITEDQRSAIRAALEAGMIEGRNPRSVALEIVGRVNRATGRREGGIVGLSTTHAAAVSKARAELLSGDAVMLRAYLERSLRDRRFDSLVRKAINGASLDAATVDHMVGRYADRLLNLRGQVIAQHEVMAALGQSSLEAMHQAVDAGALKAEAITGVWHTAMDPRVRDSHAAQNRIAVPLNGVFPNGQRYPGDPAVGAAESAGCRCWLEMRIDFMAGLT